MFDFFARDRRVVDPVCGMKVLVGGPRYNHMGRTFHFCSEHCADEFRKNPGRFVR